MGNICDCSTGKLNTAPNSCPDLLQITKRIILVPKYKADGTVNEFANVAAVTKDALQAKFDENDIDDRFSHWLNSRMWKKLVPILFFKSLTIEVR